MEQAAGLPRGYAAIKRSSANPYAAKSSLVWRPRDDFMTI